MKRSEHVDLSRRERQIMDVIYRKDSATAAEVMDNIPDPPSYSAVRALLRILEDKGHLKHDKVGPRYVYKPTVSVDRAKTTAMRHVVSTFFEGSVSQAVAALLDLQKRDLNEEEVDRLAELISQAKREGR
ncbi:MAG: BlaI/MecI/CopY family transcriptional regulator [Bacteroidetes bacterium]|nr:BlaI/MecI/CopY family transcriptional regulator [Bacteroidota bacterium]MCH8246476.1 BlaI/MecI/CopY family transcriptional regulator [Bacteroidota bacterium]